MSRPFIVLLTIYEIVCLALAVLGAWFVCLFIRWDDEVSTFTGGETKNGPPTIRGDLPSWAWPWATIDERMPGGMYEATVVEVHRKYGRYWCSVYWLIRNRMMGLTEALFGHPPANRYEHYKWKKVGPFWMGYGYKVYRSTPQARWDTGPFVEMPSVTFRRSRS